MNEFKELLLKKKEKLEGALKSLKESSKPVDLNSAIGRVTRIDALEKREINLYNKRQFEDVLTLVDQALQRIKIKSYGVCPRCEEEIERKRLLAMPEAIFCINCQK
jgi:DnaK suppressor protein